MARPSVDSESTQPRRGGAGPWAAFVLAMVVVMTAGLTMILISLPRDIDQTNAKLHAGLPFLPDFKVPAAPPMPKG